jgi:CheY-like chemotaxis protein
VAPAADAKEIKISADITEDPLMVSVDPDRMRQVVWNLLANAVKFTPKGGEVSLRAGREGSDVVIEVADTGEGIRADVLPLVFDAFHQADASTTRRHGGLGLGLAIVKQLVSAHGGAVRAESEGIGKGAKFHVRLPARAVVSSVRSSALDGLRDSVIGIQEPSMVRLSGLCILVVDDDEDALALVSEVLRAQGAEVHEASSAQEALEKFPVSRPHLLVSDIGMPQEDGLSLIRKIRALPIEQGGNIPAIALTAYASAEDAKRSVAAGFHLHLTKPVEIALLVSSVESLRESPPIDRASS